MNRRYVASLLLTVSIGAMAQTKVDLGKQSKDIDFSGASFVRPFPVGAVLPAVCTVGQMFFLTTAPAGINECVSTNSWAQIQQQTSGVTAGTIDVKRTSSTVLTIGSMCSIPTPCLFRIGSAVYSLLAPATLAVSSGSGIATIYIDGNANLTVGVSTTGNPNVTCSGCIVIGAITQYPLNSIPLATWNATSGAWDASGTSNVSMLSIPATFVAGQNISIAETAGTVTISGSDSGSSGGSGSGSGSGTTTVSGFNPADPTQFYRDHLYLASGFNNGVDGWSFAGSCQYGNGFGATGFSQQTVISATWAQTSSSSGSTCSFYFPAAFIPTYGTGTYDYWSGTTPAQLWISALYMTPDANGTHYIGLTTDLTSFTDFIGCRQSGSGNWFAVIRSGGTDVASADTGASHDGVPHRVVIDNNSGVANTIRCVVDGANVGTAAGTIPSERFGWSYISGATATGAAAVTLVPFEYTIFLQGLPRL